MTTVTPIIPRQARSRDTLARLERAAVELLESRTWDELTLTDLVRRARSSIGSFYNLFGDKDAFLDHLDEQYAQDLTASIARQLEARPERLAGAVRQLMAGLIAFHRRRRGLIRALVLRARNRREPAYDERTRRMNQTLPVLCAWLGKSAPTVAAERLELAFSFCFSALRDRVLFPESVELSSDLEDDELADELADLFCHYALAGSGPS